jgi:mono/diheme cytochrome c family protein
MRLAYGVAPALAVLFTGACSSSGSPASPGAPAAPAALTLAPVAWNTANVDVGTVQAVAEQDQAVLVFGTKGITALVSGSVVSTDDSVTAWRSAAMVPSADGLSSWMIGVDDAGHVQRVIEAATQDVSDRYGLANDKVQSVAGATGRVAFVTESGLAIADGANVTRYATPARSVAAAGTAIAFADGGAVRIFDRSAEIDVTLEGAQLVAYDGAGHLLAATTHALFEIDGAGARQVFDAGPRTIHQLAAAGANVWLSVDGDLGMWQGSRVALASGGGLAPDARLVGSASGDVWTISGGQLLRWSGQAAAGGDEGAWTSAIQPIYAAVCSNCHSPAGSGKDSSHVDLSTYSAWSDRRARIHARVVEQAGTASSMPPPGSGYALTDAQRSAIDAWSKP